MGASRFLGTAVVVALALPLFGMPQPAAADMAAATFTPGEEFEGARCPVEVPDAYVRDVTCGYITVPERRAAGADPERTLRLAVAIISSRASEPAADPLVFPTTGGPGGSSLRALDHFLEWADWVGDRDVVLVEQRGAELADPTLDCPELDAANLIVDGTRAPDSETVRYVAQLQKCRDRLAEDGVDLGAYTSAASAADLADLRRVLGYDAWNLYGVSYGARLAMTVMRDHPAGLRSVILDGPVPIDVNHYEAHPAGLATAIDTVAAHCAADADCSARYPDVLGSLVDVLETIDEAPIVVEVKNPADRSPVRMELTAGDISQGLFDALYDPESVRILPFVIDQLAQGNIDPVVPLAQRSLDREGWPAEGLTQSVECAEELPFNDDARVAEARAAHPATEFYDPLRNIRESCEVWAVPASAAVEDAPVTSAIPTLLVVGSYDPVTPRALADLAAAGLSSHFLYELPSSGHAPVWTSGWTGACPGEIAAQFLADPAAEPDASCVARMPSTDFLTTSDIDPTSAIYRLNGDLVEDRDPVQLAILAVLVVVLLATLGYGIVYALSPAVRSSGNAPEGTVLAASASAALNLAFVAGLVFVLVRTDPLILGFGLPASAWPLLLLPFLALPLTIMVIVLLVRAWMNDDGSLTQRILLSVSAAAGLGFAVWLLSRGLLTL
jgi:pimeloyl-ACP methyl ester carboxylesterase